MLSKLLSATSYRFPRVLVLMVFGGSEGVWWWYKSLIMSQVADIRGSVQDTVIQVPVLILIMEGCLLRLIIKVLLVFSLSLSPPPHVYLSYQSNQKTLNWFSHEAVGQIPILYLLSECMGTSWE